MMQPIPLAVIKEQKKTGIIKGKGDIQIFYIRTEMALLLQPVRHWVETMIESM